MNKVTAQFKKEVGISLRELADKIDRTEVWAGSFVSGRYKHHKNIKHLSLYISTILGINIEIILKYALGQIEDENIDIPKLDMKTYQRLKYQEYKSKGLVKKPIKKQPITREEIIGMINDLRTEIIGE